MNQTELGMVDYSTLQNRRGHLELLKRLVDEELAAKQPSDAVIFMGPLARYGDSVSGAIWEKQRDTTPHFYYFQFRPFFRTTANLPDSIHQAVSKLKGRTAIIHSPGEFAKAIEQVERRASSAR
jgi:hypothetical protein